LLTSSTCPSSSAGAAWAGETAVTEIAVSADGGQTWEEAQWVDAVTRHAWRRWQFEWRTPERPGKYTLLARAKDEKGAEQPAQHDPHHKRTIFPCRERTPGHGKPSRNEIGFWPGDRAGG
jgi:hypothetical protein